MLKSFKTNITAEFLKLIEDSSIGKGVTKITGLSVFEILNHFELNVPHYPNLTLWSVCYDSGVHFDIAHIDYVILLLKYVWLYSLQEKNEHCDSLIELVSRELMQFEKDLLIEDSQKKLIDSHTTVQAQLHQIAIKDGYLENANRELKIRRKKEQKISKTNSHSASLPRSCKKVIHLLTKLVEKQPQSSIKELWSSISDERDGSDLYRENEKVHHDECGCREFGIQAFYHRIKIIKTELKKKF